MKPQKIYAELLEQTALDQFNAAMSLPCVVRGALMPDAHTGYTLPIGAVIATDGMVFPSWVGFDIGCGVCAIKLEGITKEQIEPYREDIFKEIYKAIPVGKNANVSEVEYSLDGLTKKGKEIAVKKKYKNALGTLGSGNHFFEVSHDEEDTVWLSVHSGSRGVGHGIATHYMIVAANCPDRIGKEFDSKSEQVLIHNPDNYSNLRDRYIANKIGKGKPKDGHFGFDEGSAQGINYIKDLNWCLDFALANRREMIIRGVKCITECLGIDGYSIDESSLINRNHNHAELKDGLWIHRKGATHAEKGMLGVIPGNMRDGSFVVMGKGCEESLCSSSHGAGRVLGRMAAKRKLNMDDFSQTMIGVTALVTEDTLDESPEAYKNIFDVMELQKDLVEVAAYLKPIINIKG